MKRAKGRAQLRVDRLLVERTTNFGTTSLQMALQRDHEEPASALLQRRPPPLRRYNNPNSESKNSSFVNSRYIYPWSTFDADIRPYLQLYRNTLQTVKVPRLDA